MNLLQTLKKESTAPTNAKSTLSPICIVNKREATLRFLLHNKADLPIELIIQPGTQECVYDFKPGVVNYSVFSNNVIIKKGQFIKKLDKEITMEIIDK